MRYKEALDRVSKKDSETSFDPLEPFSHKEIHSNTKLPQLLIHIPANLLPLVFSTRSSSLRFSSTIFWSSSSSIVQGLSLLSGHMLASRVGSSGWLIVNIYVANPSLSFLVDRKLSNWSSSFASQGRLWKFDIIRQHLDDASFIRL